MKRLAIPLAAATLAATPVAAQDKQEQQPQDQGTESSITTLDAQNTGNPRIRGAVDTETTHPAADFGNIGELVRASDIIGGAVYTTRQEHADLDWLGDEWNRAGADWTDIGDIEDVVLNSRGHVVGVLARLGGILDAGYKHVLLREDDVRMVIGRDGGYAVVTRSSERQLEQMSGLGADWAD